jgi:hypothetical protein
MSQMPSAREHALYDLRRKRAALATTIVLIAAIASVFLTGILELMALAVAAWLAYFTVPSWVGIEPRFPLPPAWAVISEHLFSFGVPMVGVLLIYAVLLKGDTAVFAVMPVAVLGALVYAVYRWRYLSATLMRVRGAVQGMSLPSRFWRHYLGYALGLAAAVPAARALEGQDVAVVLGAYVGAFLLVKLLVDLALPQPPLTAERFSTAALQLALMSPVWFGLPWGAFLIGMVASLQPTGVLAGPPMESAIVALYATVAAVVVFSAIAAVAFAIDLAGEEG